jgi:energy-coupling factor transport system ATP-binding protein
VSNAVAETAGAAGGWPVGWDGVRFGYGGADVVDGVSLTVDAGEAVSLVGPNGAGKTTLARMVMALVRPREGRVRVGDWDVAARRPDEMAARVGYAFQHAERQLFARTVREDVAFGPRRLGREAGVVDAVLAELDLATLADWHPYDVSPPLRRRIALAGVLAMAPGVLLLDEPTAGFDRDDAALVVAALRRRHAAGVTLIVVTHDLALADAVTSRRVRLEAGRISPGP